MQRGSIEHEQIIYESSNRRMKQLMDWLSNPTVLKYGLVFRSFILSVHTECHFWCFRLMLDIISVFSLFLFLYFSVCSVSLSLSLSLFLSLSLSLSLSLACMFERCHHNNIAVWKTSCLFYLGHAVSLS